jgi:hypothetical protein
MEGFEPVRVISIFMVESCGWVAWAVDCARSSVGNTTALAEGVKP